MGRRYAMGVDIGGNHISCALVDIVEGRIIKTTLSEGDIDNKAEAGMVLAAWAKVLRRTLGEVDGGSFAGIGFGIPGPFEYEKGIGRYSQVEKYYSLNGIDVAGRLRDLLKTDTPFRFMNDASAFAVGEAWIGSAANVSRCLCLTLGTGFGSAFVSDGVPVVGSDDVPPKGCVWHLPYRNSIADNFFSTRWFVKRFFEDTGVETDGVRAIAANEKHKNSARLLFKEYGENMAHFLAPWIIKFNAGAIVVGGNISSSYHLFGDVFEATLKDDGIKTQVTLSMLKEHSAIVGSARMLEPAYWEKIKPVLPLM